MVRGNQEGRQASSLDPAVLDYERGPRLENVQAGLRYTPFPPSTNFIYRASSLAIKFHLQFGIVMEQDQWETEK